MDSLRLGLMSALVLAGGCYQGVEQPYTFDGTDELATADSDDPSEGSEGVSSSSGDGDGDGDGDTGWSTGDGEGDDDGEDTGWTTGEEGTCSQHAQQQGWKAFYCDQGSGVCSGAGVSTDDCELCCSGPSCGDLAADNGWDWASCEQNGNGACSGAGTPTYDCDYCCGAVDRPQPTGNGFGYPVGDKSSSPAGGWVVWQVMAHYWAAYGGRHLAQDIASAQGGVASVDAPVYSVADGVVRYAGPNGSSYKNVVLIEHDDGEGGKICSFYGHVNPPMVSTGQDVTRGQQITSVRDWALCVDGGASSNTHLHYVLVSKPLCDASAAANGSLMCGYDKGGPNNVVDLATEPYTYTAINDICGDFNYPDAFISPTKFIDDHHY